MVVHLPKYVKSHPRRFDKQHLENLKFHVLLSFGAKLMMISI